MNPYARLFDIANRVGDDDSEAQSMVAMFCLLVLILCSGAALVALISWHWIVGLPVAAWVVWRIIRFALHGPAEEQEEQEEGEE